MAERFSFYKEHPKTCAPKDYWRQVARTRDGEPVGEDQIQMIVDGVLAGLELSAADVLLDLCCGNGALSDRIFARCNGGLGVDFSPALIEVAKRDFERPDRVYVLEDVLAFIERTPDTARFTKALCYGSFMYLPEDVAEGVLRTVGARFAGVTRLMIGNLPDRHKARQFLGPYHRPGIEDDPEAATGIWRTEEEFADLANRCGWDCSFTRQPPGFFAAGYRYDAVLTRPLR